MLCRRNGNRRLSLYPHFIVTLATVCLVGLMGGRDGLCDQGAIVPEAQPGDLGSRSPGAPGETVSLGEALNELRSAIAAKEVAIESTRARLEDAADDTAAASARLELEHLHRETEELNRHFRRLITQADESLFREEGKEEFDPKDKILGLLQPVFDELEKLTANSREISRLQATRKAQDIRMAEAARALARIDTVLAEDLDEELRQRITALTKVWTDRLTDAQAQISSVDYELRDRQASQKPFLDSASSFFRRFLRTRGFNLFVGLLTFVCVFVGLNYCRSLLGSLFPGHGQWGLGSRVADLLFRGAAMLASIGALLFVFNLAGDWFLLGIALVFLLGLGWVAVKAAPALSQQVTLVLNMGAVREGEYLNFDGTPWFVESLGFTATLVNERLDGGRRQLPVRMLIGLCSRPMGSCEELFPCKKDDWVQLSDGTTGRVDYQTPATVQLVLLGGAQKTYSTPAFLEKNPQNLSTNFRIEFPFGIDYRHQRDCTSSIPKLMTEALNKGLAEQFPGVILAASAEFQEAAASSLDYEIQIDVSGSAAALHERIRYRAASILVDACNQHGWEIPFQQLTVHRAQPGEDT